MERITLYTAVAGKRDPKRDDIICFTEYDKFVLPVMNAKIYKVLPHQFLDTDISIWTDANIFLNVSPEQIVNEFLGDADMAVFQHFDRDCIYDEAPAAAGLFENPETKQAILDHAEHYRKLGFPAHAGLVECNFIVRRHNKRVEAFNNAWWAEICRHSFRDQISFPYVLAKSDVRLRTTTGNIRNHPYFTYVPH